MHPKLADAALAVEPITPATTSAARGRRRYLGDYRHFCYGRDEMSAANPGGNGNEKPDPEEPHPRPGYGPAGGYAWIDPWTGLPTARYQPPPGDPGYEAASRGRPSLLAGVSLICGLLQVVGLFVLFSNILLAIPAVICGVIALRRLTTSGESGRGMAIAGLVLGILGIIYFVVVIAAFVTVGTGNGHGAT